MVSDPKVVTFGCRLNAYESEKIKDLLKQSDLANAIVVNTCAVTKEAERQALQTIRKLKKKNPESFLVVTGCAAQIFPEKFAELEEVDRVLGNREKLDPESFLAESTTRVRVNDIMAIEETAPHLVQSFEGKTRAFLEIQNGCNHRCTFCIIPYGRGNSRSVPIGTLVSHAQRLLQEGYQEIVLTGVDLTSYGEDLPGKPSFAQMLRRLLIAVPTLKRLRLSSLDPAEVTSELLEVLKTFPQIMPSIHLSVQAGDDLILKRMKRRHLRQDVLTVCHAIRQVRPDVVFGADFIAGFPTETEESFLRTCALVQEAGLTFLHVFPYSPRPGTPAARMPQVDQKIVKQRASILRKLGKQQVEKCLQAMCSTEQTILIEKDGTGRAENFVRVQPDQKLAQGTLARVRICSVVGDHVKGNV